jgi:hypothetical protein
MKVEPQDYERMRAWMAVVGSEVFPGSNAVQELDRIAAKSPANARKGLAMAIGDLVDFTSDWMTERATVLDADLRAKGLPTLAEIRAVFSRDIQRIVRRGQIRNEVEYYAIKNAADFPGGDQERLWDLLEAYENSA